MQGSAPRGPASARTCDNAEAGTERGNSGDEEGLCSRAFSYIVAALEGAGTKPVAPASAWICRCSAVEVYNDTCIDLLAPKHESALLNTREDPTLLEVSSADAAAISTLKKTMQALAPLRPFFLFKGVHRACYASASFRAAAAAGSAASFNLLPSGSRSRWLRCVL
jgi:hypothetical protein